MPTTNYTVFDGEIVEENRNGTVRGYVPDPQGNTVALLDNSQNITDEWEYWPYGEVKSHTGPSPTPFTFIGVLGYYSNPTGRVYVRARYYNAQSGQWQTVDPMWPRLHAYQYVGGSPLTFVDPSGSVQKKVPTGREGECAVFECSQYGGTWGDFWVPIATHQFLCVKGPHGGCSAGLYPDKNHLGYSGTVGDTSNDCDFHAARDNDGVRIECDEITNRTEKALRCEIASAVCECIRLSVKKPPNWITTGSCYNYPEQMLDCARDRVGPLAESAIRWIQMFRL